MDNGGFSCSGISSIDESFPSPLILSDGTFYYTLSSYFANPDIFNAGTFEVSSDDLNNPPNFN